TVAARPRHPRRCRRRPRRCRRRRARSRIGWSASMTVRTLIDPSSGEAVGDVADSTPQQVEAALAAAAAAQRAWGTALPSERAAVLLALADQVERHADELSRTEVTETGKPWAVMRDGEVPFAVDNLRFFAAAARSVEGTAAGSFSAGY